VAALIEEKTGVRPEVVPGGRGEFTVWVGDQKVAGKGPDGFPTERQIARAVQEALAAKQAAD
jgi:hypothetical protein